MPFGTDRKSRDYMHWETGAFRLFRLAEGVKAGYHIVIGPGDTFSFGISNLANSEVI
jgi:hypothetical protein